MRYLLQFTTLLFSIFLFSCSVQQQSKKKTKADLLTYFQNTPELVDSTGLPIQVAPALRLQPGDMVGITVTSLNNEADALFNPFNQAKTGSSGELMQRENGYMLDENGAIEFPLVGAVKVGGLTTAEASAIIRDKLLTQLKSPFVSVRLLNFKVSVLGEVTHPSVLNVANQKISLTEAISQAGDLTIYGKRENILVVRERDGKREFARLDLRSQKTFQSPYFYLKPNDVVYVEPKKSKKVLAGGLFPWIPTIVSGLSLLVIIVTNVLN